MRVLGVDPGTTKMGVGVVDAHGADVSLVRFAVLAAPRRLPLPQRLKELYRQLSLLLEETAPAEMAIEEPFVTSGASRSALAVGQAQAVAMLAAAQRGVPVATYSPAQVKRAVTDYGASSKAQVQEMVALLLGLIHETPPPDAADALAVAICHASARHARDLAAATQE